MTDEANTADLWGDIEISVVITRADGTVEDVGLVTASYASSPFRQWRWDHIGRRLAARRSRRANMSAAHKEE